MGVMIKDYYHMDELERNKKIIKDIRGIVTRSSYFSFGDEHETHAIYEIHMNGEGRYLENDENGKVQMEKSFSVSTEEIEKFCLKIVDIMHHFDRVDMFYDDSCEEVELLFSGGRVVLPRGMAVKRRCIEDAWNKFRDNNIVDQLI